MVRKFNPCMREEGFTLIEVMVAALILVVAILPLSGIINRGTLLSEQAQEKTIAMGLAVDYMEKIKAFLPKSPADFTPSATLNYTDPQTLGDLVATSEDNAIVITKNTEKDVQKQYKMYLTLNGTADNLGSSFTTENGSYTNNKMFVTITVLWEDYISGTPQKQKINLTSEMVGR